MYYEIAEQTRNKNPANNSKTSAGKLSKRKKQNNYTTL